MFSLHVNPRFLDLCLSYFYWQNQDANPKHIPFALIDYLELVDYTGRCVRSDKRGAIPDKTPKLLQRLNLSPNKWLVATTGMETHFNQAIGPLTKLSQLCERLKQRWLQGQRACQQLYSN